MTDVTADLTSYPSNNDIAVVEKEGRFLTEVRQKEFNETHMENHVVSGFTVPATDPDLSIEVAIGEAVIDGRRIEVGGATAVTVADDDTNYLFLQLSFDGNGDVDGADIISNITGTPPASSVALAEVIAAAGAITDTTDVRPLGPYKDSKVFGPALGIDLGGDTGGAFSPFVGGAGEQTLTGLSVPISRENLQGIDTRVLFIGVVGIDGLTAATSLDIRIKDGATVIAKSSFGTIQSGDYHFTIMGAATLLGNADHTITMTVANSTGGGAAVDGQIQCIAIGKG